MSSHFDNLSEYVANLKSARILDIGSGRGKFVIEAVKRGMSVVGLEKSSDYIEMSRAGAKKMGFTIEIVEGLAESLPFADNSFDFINLSEVIEHVDDPEKIISEAYRVLRKNGSVYLSVPSRFGIFDPHYHLYFVNWLPRGLSDWYIGWWGKHKDYSHTKAGKQRLQDMNYYRFRKIRRILFDKKFSVSDVREMKIAKMIKNKPLRIGTLFIYKMIRPFYFDTFHLFLVKKS